MLDDVRDNPPHRFGATLTLALDLARSSASSWSATADAD